MNNGSYWRYRILVHEYKWKDKKDVEETDYIHMLHEVHYKNNKPDAYTKEPIAPRGETIEELKGDLELMNLAFELPPLWYGDNFPQEFKK